jgi:anti-anti-sigma factor
MADWTAVEDDGTTRMVLRGEIDLGDYYSLSVALQRLEEPGPRLLAIDLREVSYMDSTGLRWLVEANERSRRAGRRMLVIPSPNATVNRIFQLCRLDEVLDLIEDSTPARV